MTSNLSCTNINFYDLCGAVLTLQDEQSHACFIFSAVAVYFVTHSCLSPLLLSLNFLKPSTFTAPDSFSGSASLERGASAELQITRCIPKHQQAFLEPLQSLD